MNAGTPRGRLLCPDALSNGFVNEVRRLVISRSPPKRDRLPDGALHGLIARSRLECPSWNKRRDRTNSSPPSAPLLSSSHPFTDAIGSYRGLILHRPNVEFIFHVAALVLYSRVWLWHTTPAAMALPGATGFGWFFRYLTFCSYTLQLVQFALCVLCRILPSEKARVATSIAADRLACALFGLANMISAMFYTIESTGGKGLIDASGRGAKPWWLGETVHALNSVIAWIDLFLVEERTFHGHSRALIVFFIVTYCSWALVVKRVHGTFPYPLMNILPFPWGFVGLAAAASCVLLSIFELGRRLKDAQRNRRRRGDSSSRKER